MSERVFYRPIYLPPVWVRENADGTVSWPSQAVKGAWIVIHTPQDYPPAYLHPPRTEEWRPVVPMVAQAVSEPVRRRARVRL